MQIHYYDEEEQKEAERQGIKPREKFWDKIKNRFQENPRLKWIIPVAVIIILAVISASWAAIKRYGVNSAEEENPLMRMVKQKFTEEEKIESNLDGIMSALSEANRHPLAIVIENHPDARPQWGLDQASVIYEAIAEGGITRFLAVYGPRGADKIGPVRSARTFFLDWTLEYDGFFAHVGGNADALDLIPHTGIKDLDQFGLGKKAYWREGSDKATEHTMFTDSAKLWEQARLKDWDISKADFTPWKFKKDEISNQNQPTEDELNQTIIINFSSNTYEVKWTHSKQDNIYQRHLAGSPHKDGRANKQLEAKNIIIQEVSRTPTVTRIGESGWTFKTTGEGKAKVIQDGKATEGTWKKKDRKSRTIFYDVSNREIEFNPGLTWIEIVHPETKVNIEN